VKNHPVIREKSTNQVKNLTNCPESPNGSICSHETGPWYVLSGNECWRKLGAETVAGADIV
jgi:hypothetical protein